MKIKLQAYKSKDGWRWRAKSRGRIIAEGGEAYERKQTMVKTLKNFLGSDNVSWKIIQVQIFSKLYAAEFCLA